MADHVVKDVRLFEIVHLVRPADETRRREAPIGQMREEHGVGHQARHRNQAPAVGGREHVVQPREVRDALAEDRQARQAA